MGKKVALICPVFNRVSYTVNMLKSVVFFPDALTAFIIDNGSTDGTLDVLPHINLDYPLIFHRFDSNKGVAKAWNTGLKMAVDKGFEYFLLINNDIILRDDCLVTLFSEYINNKYHLLSATNYRDSCSSAALDKLNPKYGIFNPIDFSCVLFNKDVIDSIGWFDENFYPGYFEDSDYLARAWNDDLSTGRLNTAVLYHYGCVTNEQVPGRIVNKSLFKRNSDLFIAKWGYHPRLNKRDGLKHYYKHPFNDLTRKLSSTDLPPVELAGMFS